MNGRKFGLIALTGGILLTLIGGALWAIKAPSSQVIQPTPPIDELLLRESDFPDCGFGCEKVEEGTEVSAREAAEVVGLPLDYQEGHSVYFLVHTYPNFKAVVQVLYRYRTEKEAVAHYKHLIDAFPLSPLGRNTPIINQSEWSFKGVKGQIIEAQDPIGIAYWLIGVRGKLLTIMGVLSFESAGEPLFKELLPIVSERMAGVQ